MSTQETQEVQFFIFEKGITCSHSSGQKWPQVTASHLFYSTKPVKSVICGHLQSPGWPQETASDRWSKWPHALIPKNVLHFSRLLTENAPQFPDRNEWRMLKGKGVAWHEGGGVKTKRRVENERDSTPKPYKKRWFETKQRSWNEKGRLKTKEMKEAGPKLVRERPETKEEASKRKDVWKTTGKGAYFETTRGDFETKRREVETKRCALKQKRQDLN